jgi:hypothetical protein
LIVLMSTMSSNFATIMASLCASTC